MKTNEKNSMKGKDGITLIALIITIIVLLILAGVAISVVTGDNGVLNQATRAADNTNEETAREELEMAYTTCQTSYLTDKATNGSVVKSSYFTEEKINEALGDKGKITGMELDEESGTRTGTYYSNNAGNSYPFRINDAGKVEIVSSATVTSKYLVGDYIEYNVPYIDMYTGYEFSSTTGWRYLKTDSEGNNYLISTGIPAILYYYYSDIANNGWYGTNDEATSLFSSTDYNDRAAAGLRLHFDQIKFSYQASGTSVSTANTGIFRKVGSVTSGSNVSLSSAFLEGGATSVRNVTYEEITDNSVGSSSVRYLKTLAKEKVTGNYTSSVRSYYWLAEPGDEYVDGLFYVSGNGNVIYGLSEAYLRCASSSCFTI